jgi:hypothetical protein
MAGDLNRASPVAGCQIMDFVMTPFNEAAAGDAVWQSVAVYLPEQGVYCASIGFSQRTPP